MELVDIDTYLALLRNALIWVGLSTRTPVGGTPLCPPRGPPTRMSAAAVASRGKHEKLAPNLRRGHTELAGAASSAPAPHLSRAGPRRL